MSLMGQQERGDGLAVDVLGVGLRNGLLNDTVHVIGIHRVLLGMGLPTRRRP